MKFFRDLLGDQSDKADEMALLAILGLLSFLGLQIYAVVWGHQPFDPRAFGEGFGLAIGGAAAGMGLKCKLENGRS